MKIVHLTAGAGNMYCGSCLHGNTLATALRQAGEDVLLQPLYTPIRTEAEEGGSVARIAYGGVNVYLQQRWAMFRHTPRLLDWLLDRPRLLRWLAKDGSRLRSEHLGALTVSVLKGEEGRQRKELEKLVRWLERHIRPDVVHLSNVLLSGTARLLSRRLGVPVVSTLSGEEAFLERIPEPHYAEARAVLRQRAADLTALVALNGYSADFMARYLGVPRERIHVIPPGLNLQGHASPGQVQRHAAARAADDSSAGTLIIGYLARVCPEKGLHQLAEAFQLLADDAELPPLRLHAAGYLDEADRPYLQSIQSRLAAGGLADRFTYLGEFDRAAKIAFLQTLDVMSVPAVFAESKGLSVLEAWANGVPVVLPAHGAFPEMVRDTGGGLLCQPHDPASLAAGLKQLLQDRALAADCGRRAQAAVHERYHAPLMAQRTIELYQNLRKKFRIGI